MNSMGDLSVQDLSVSYTQQDGSSLAAVQRISFSLPAGTSIGIVGESGSGKSTLARALMGYTRNGARIDEGFVMLGRQKIVPSQARHRRFARLRMAYVPQNPLSSLTPHMKVGEQVCEAVQVSQDLDAQQARAAALELLAATGLPNPAVLYGRYPHQLSGGQRQRVVIAAAMATRPEVLILDEPTTALDKTTERQVLDLLQGLQKRFNTSLVYVSHDLHVVSSVCDQILVMRHGQLVEQGDTAAVFAQPRQAYTRQLLEAMPTVTAKPAASWRLPSTLSQPALQSSPLLELHDVSFRYPQSRSWKFWEQPPIEHVKPVLAYIGLTLNKGETLGLVGESGSGKSTIAALVAGLHTSYGGMLRFEGKALPAAASQRTREQRRRIQIIFQDALSSLNPRHKVADILMRPLQLFFGMDHACAYARILELAQALQLDPELLERYPRQLSGGQQQRVAIARAFAAQPDLVICDEITSALDTSIQAQVLRNLRELQRSTGTTILFISHDLGVVQHMAQNVMVLHQGRVQACGPTEEIFQNPPNDYTRLLIEAASSTSMHAATEPCTTPSSGRRPYEFAEQSS